MTQSTKSVTLAEFLLARIADDEKGYAVDAAIDPDDLHCSECGGHGSYGYDPAQALRECEAKRAVVEDYALLAHQGTISFPGPNAARHFAKVDAYYDALQHLAAVYSDHPDYREEWKP